MSTDLPARGGGEVLLEVAGLVKHYPGRRSLLRPASAGLRAVDGVDLAIRHGETVGLVGESGCGKSTLARTVVRLEEPTAGSVRFRGRDLASLSARQLRRLRRQVQIVFQDPYGTLNPRMTVRSLVCEGWRIHPEVVAASERDAAFARLMNRVGLDPTMGDRYPHQFSGGQRQRIGIARALALDPEVLILDEPVSALDVSVQAQVVNLLEELQEEFGFAALFVSHDLGVVRHVADRVAVMYLGRIVEEGPVDAVFERASHPYTQALLAAVPVAQPGRRRVAAAGRRFGEVPSALEPPSGCRFRTRCPLADARCAAEDPQLTQRGVGHSSACHHPVEASPW